MVGESEELIDRSDEGSVLGGEPAVGERMPDEELPANDGYEVTRDVDVQRQRVEPSGGGANRLSDPRRDPIR